MSRDYIFMGIHASISGWNVCFRWQKFDMTNIHPVWVAEVVWKIEVFMVYLWLSTFLVLVARWWFQFFFNFHPYLVKWSYLTNIFQMGWNHQLGCKWTSIGIPEPQQRQGMGPWALQFCNRVPCIHMKYMDVSKNRGPQNGWFIMENPIILTWDNLGVPLFLETPISKILDVCISIF